MIKTVTKQEITSKSKAWEVKKEQLKEMKNQK